MVCQLTVAARNRTGRARWGHGKVPGDAHVHNVGFTKNGHESRRTPTGFRFVTRKGQYYILFYDSLST